MQDTEFDTLINKSFAGFTMDLADDTTPGVRREKEEKKSSASITQLTNRVNNNRL